MNVTAAGHAGSWSQGTVSHLHADTDMPICASFVGSTLRPARHMVETWADRLVCKFDYVSSRQHLHLSHTSFSVTGHATRHILSYYMPKTSSASAGPLMEWSCCGQAIWQTGEAMGLGIGMWITLRRILVHIAIPHATS